MGILATTSAVCAGLAISVVITLPMPANADDEAVEDDSKRCLNARSIRRTEVIDDNHVVFEIQGRRLFLNVLPKSCTGLSQDRRFSYEIFTRSLCARDKIRILRDAGGTFYEGKSCSLGRFHPVTYDDLVAFGQDKTRPPAPQEVETAEVEDVVTD